MMSESRKNGRINSLIRVIGLIIAIVGLLIVYTAYASAAELEEYHLIFATVGIITLLIGFITLTLRIK